MCILLCTRRSQHLLKITILSPRKALTEFQLGLFRSKENRLYIIGYPLSAPMMRINVSLESDSLELKSKKKVKISFPLNRILRLYNNRMIHRDIVAREFTRSPVFVHLFYFPHDRVYTYSHS